MNKLTKWQTNKSKHTWNVFNILYITVKHSQLCLFLLWSNVINIQSVYSDLNSIGTNNHKHQTLTVCNHIKHSKLRDKKALHFLLNGIYIMKKLCVQLNDMIQNSYCKTITCHLNIILCFAEFSWKTLTFRWPKVFIYLHTLTFIL